MDEMNAFERQIATVVRQSTMPARSVDATPIMRAATAESPRWTLGTAFGAARFVVAGVIVALFAGLLLAGVLTQPSDDGTAAVGASASVPSGPTAEPATESAAPREVEGITLPLDLPEGTRSGTLDTPLGPARWAYLSGDSLVDDVPWPPRDGRLSRRFGRLCGVRWPVADAVDRPHRLDPRTHPDRPIASRDRRGATADTWWIYSRGEPAQLWGSADGSVWTEVDTSSIEPQGPEGFIWRPSWVSGPPAVFGGTTIVPFTFGTNQEGSALGLADKTSLTAIEPGLYRVAHEWTGEDVLVRFEDTGTGVRVSDEDSGEELAFLEGVRMEFIERLVLGQPELTVQTLAILGEDGLTSVELPEAIAQAEWASFLADDRGFVAYSTQPDESIRVHRSQDGREWSETEVLNGPAEPHRLRLISGVLVVEAEDGRYVSWDDGILHRQPYHSGPERAHSTPFGAGWVVVPGQAPNRDRGPTVDSISYEPLGGAALEIDVSALGIPFTAQDVDSLSRNTIVVGSYVVIDADSERFEQWIISFDDVPSSIPPTDR